MKAVSLFSGIGGLDLGLERAGIETVLQVEVDPFCRRVLEKHWPDVRRIEDMRDVTAADCEGADLVYGGFPCQPASTAGAMRGVADERWMWPEFFRIVREVRPRYVLVENVTGILVRGLLGVVLGDLASIGYDAEWESIPAAAVGAPHLRYRVFVVSYPAGVRRHGPVLDEREGEHDAVGRGEQPGGDGGYGALADTYSQARHSPWSAGQEVFRPAALQRLRRRTGGIGGEWAIEPDVGRVAHGVPDRVDRLRALGNAVVPQVAEWVGRRLMEVDSCTTSSAS